MVICIQKSDHHIDNTKQIIFRVTVLNKFIYIYIYISRTFKRIIINQKQVFDYLDIDNIQVILVNNNNNNITESCKFAATQTPVENYQLKLVWKTVKGIIMIKFIVCTLIIGNKNNVNNCWW